MATQIASRITKAQAPPGARDRLREVLERDVKNNNIVVSPRKRINRAHYARILGYVHARMYQISDIFDEYEAQIALVYVKPEPKLSKALRALLEADFELGELPGSLEGKINRTHYAAKLGCTPSALTPFVTVFAEFERRSDFVTGPMRHFPAMRAWLKESFEAGELIVRAGKIDRTAFAKRFGLRGGTFFSVHPEIRDLFEEYDARVELEGYIPAVQKDELERLRKALAAQPELNKDRLTINAKTLSSVAKVPQRRFRDRHFAEAIATTQAGITARAMASKIDPYFHDRVFCFSGLLASWGADFVERVAVRFKQVISGVSKNSSANLYLMLLNALEWIASSDISHCQAIVAEARYRGRITDSKEWEEALFAYRKHLIDCVASGRMTGTSVDTMIQTLRTSVQALSSGGVVPRLEDSFRSVKYSRRRAGRVRSLAEAPGHGQDATDYVAFARAHFEDARKALEIDVGTEDSEPFFAGIGQELKTASGLPDDPSMAVKIVLERRLDALRERAKAIVEEAELLYERGQELIAKSNIDCDKFRREYLDTGLSDYRKRNIVRDLFSGYSANGKEFELGVANLLTYIDQMFGSVAPSAGRPDPVYGNFFQSRYLNFGGISAIAPMLGPEASAVGAVLTLYLIDSGANVSVGRTLNRECTEASDMEGFRRITGHKARAKGKPIIVDLPEDASSVRAIDWLLSAGRRLPEHVEHLSRSGSDDDRLFLMRLAGRVQLMTPHWYRSWFKQFTASIPSLATLNLTPNMIRPSVLLHASLSNDGRLMTGMAWAQHTQGVAQGYQQKWPTRRRYDQMVREFLVSFESLVMKNVPAAADKLGITIEQFEARLGNLQATGLGTFCLDGRGRPGAGGTSCSTVDCWNDCPNMLIVAEVEAIASLQLWQAALRQAQPEMERDQPERWDEVWLPWLCLTDVVEEKMARQMIKIWKAATKRASEISSQPGYVPARPW